MQRTTTSQGKKTIFLHTGPKSDLWDCNFTVENAIMKSRCDQYPSTRIFRKLSRLFSSYCVGRTSHRGQALSPIPSWEAHESGSGSPLSWSDGHAGTLWTPVTEPFGGDSECNDAGGGQSPGQCHGLSSRVSFPGPKDRNQVPQQREFGKIRFPITNKTSAPTSSSCQMKVQCMVLWLLYKFTYTNSSFFSQDSQVSPQNEHKHLHL